VQVFNKGHDHVVEGAKPIGSEKQVVRCSLVHGAADGGVGVAQFECAAS
jgi:hypothetical protein